MHDIVAVAILVGVFFKSEPHDELPEEQIDGRRHQLADDRFTENFEKIKRFEIGKDGRGEERQASHAVRIAMRVRDPDGAAGVVAYQVPAFNSALDAEGFDGCGESVEFAEAVAYQRINRP